MPSTIEKEEPLGVLYILSYIKANIKDAEVDFIDAHETREDPEQVYERIKLINYDVIAITVLTIGAAFAYKLARLINNSKPKMTSKIIFGGAHSSALPQECLENGADYCIIGEGEISTCQLLSYLSEGKDISPLKGIAYLGANKQMVIAPRQELITNLSELDFPDYSILKGTNYNTTIHLDTGNKALPIMASRGCANDCPFCCSKLMWNRKLRYRSVQNVVDEIERDYNVHDVKEYHFYDDDFLVNKTFIREFGREILRRGLEIKFCCLSTCKSFLNLESDDIILLKEAGLSLIELGIESLIPEVLLYLGKTYTINELNDLVERLNKYEINAHPLLMYMVPEETLSGHIFQAELFKKLFGSLDYINSEWKIDNYLFLNYAAAYTPLPGTRFLKEVNDYGILLTDDWNHFNTEKIVFIPHSLLNDIPVKASDTLDVGGCMVQLKNVANRILLKNAEDLVPNFVENLWKAIDGKRSIKAITGILCNQFESVMKREDCLAFTVSEILALTLNKSLIPFRKEFIV